MEPQLLPHLFMLRQIRRQGSALSNALHSYRAVSASRQLQKKVESDTKRPEPGTVSPYEHHIFLRFPPKQYPDAGPGSWWPKIIERQALMTTWFD